MILDYRIFRQIRHAKEERRLCAKAKQTLSSIIRNFTEEPGALVSMDWIQSIQHLQKCGSTYDRVQEPYESTYDMLKRKQPELPSWDALPHDSSFGAREARAYLISGLFVHSRTQLQDMGLEEQE